AASIAHCADFPCEWSDIELGGGKQERASRSASSQRTLRLCGEFRRRPGEEPEGPPCSPPCSPVRGAGSIGHACGTREFKRGITFGEAVERAVQSRRSW